MNPGERVAEVALHEPHVRLEAELPRVECEEPLGEADVPNDPVVREPLKGVEAVHLARGDLLRDEVGGVARAHAELAEHPVGERHRVQGGLEHRRPDGGLLEDLVLRVRPLAEGRVESIPHLAKSVVLALVEASLNERSRGREILRHHVAARGQTTLRMTTSLFMRRLAPSLVRDVQPPDCVPRRPGFGRFGLCDPSGGTNSNMQRPDILQRRPDQAWKSLACLVPVKGHRAADIRRSTSARS